MLDTQTFDIVEVATTRRWRPNVQVKAMPKWLMKFGLEAHLGTKPGVAELVFNHPQGTYQVHLQNADVRPGIELPLLHAYVLFDADDIKTAAADGARHLD